MEVSEFGIPRTGSASPPRPSPSPPLTSGLFPAWSRSAARHAGRRRRGIGIASEDSKVIGRPFSRVCRQNGLNEPRAECSLRRAWRYGFFGLPPDCSLLIASRVVSAERATGVPLFSIPTGGFGVTSA